MKLQKPDIVKFENSILSRNNIDEHKRLLKKKK